MILNVEPIQKLRGSIHLPASKSYSIRAAIIAACGGASRIKHISDCDDAKVALDVAKNLGATIEQKGDIWHIQALDKKSATDFNVGESGTSLRFLLPLLPLYVKKATVKGKGTLVGRPNAHLCESLRRCGLDIRGEGTNESVPIEFKSGQLKAGTIEIDGSLSSQFISALLIALPRLKDDSKVIITGSKMVSKDYILMTRQILALAGIEIKPISEREIIVKGNQQFKGLKNFYVPSDYGLAAFPLAAAILIDSNITLKGNLADDLVQSDGHILEFIKRLGVTYTKTPTALKIRGPFELRGGTFSLKDCPDLVPIMAVLALFVQGGSTKLVDIHHARAKESDRISDLRKELLKVGAQVEESDNGLTIYPLISFKSGQLLDSHNDHRLAMAFTVLGLKIGCKIKSIESSHKSYPGFVKDIEHLTGRRFAL